MKKLLATSMVALITIVSAPVYADGVDGSLNTNNNNNAEQSHNQHVTNSPSNSHNKENSENTNHYHGDTTHSTTNNSGTVVNQNQPANQTTTSKIKSNQAAPAYAPALTTSGQDTCFGSQSSGVSIAGFGASGGSTVVDENCVLMKQAKLLTQLGLKDAAILLLMNGDDDIREAVLGANPDLYIHLYDEERITDAFRNN